MPMGAMTIKSKPLCIPWTTVLAWSVHHGYLAGDLALLNQCICEMDTEYLAWWAKRQKE